MWQEHRGMVIGGTMFRPWFFLCVVLLFVSSKPCFSIGSDTLSAAQRLSGSQTLVSQGSIYELGFFRPGNSLNVYLGIWFKNFAERIEVWVANRDKPLSDPSSLKLGLSEDGNLVLLDSLSKTLIWTTNLVSPPISNSTEAVLLDDGNFILRNGSEPSTIYWQSFDHPTDTWMPGAKLGINKLTGKTQLLTSWKNSEDPAPGRFSLQVDPNGSSQFFMVWNMSRIYWTSGVWNGQRFSLVPEMGSNDIFNFSFISNERETYFTYSLYNSSVLSRLVMEQTGQITLRLWLANLWNWKFFQASPADQSAVYAFCGAFGIFNVTSLTHCACLPGFVPLSPNETQRLNDWSGGCVRKTRLQCESNISNRKNDGFRKISILKLPPANSKAYPARNGKQCASACSLNCSCTAYAYNGSGCSIWDGALLNLQLSDGSNTTQNLYIKLAASELLDVGGNRRKSWVIIAILVPPAMLVTCFSLWHLWRKKLKQNGAKYPSEDLLVFDFDGSSNATDHETNARYNLTRGKKNDADLPFFSFASVSAATDGFSSSNKLGQGGFGPVYKGKLLKGQEIAIKRLSERSGQGLEEFRNEIVLIAKLQHRNLVRLLGCCMEQDEHILIYEYMINKSLDFFLFDPSKREMLDWMTRIHIIEGIAQGLLYLHQYSRLRIIHRDLKASNILLDDEMNPKISDFGMARIFGGNQSQANTNRIVGTYGYMAPEYAMDGIFSIKSDVFSFGVLLLEIVSGRRNTGFYHSNSLNLLGHAWDMWNADRGLDLLDPVVNCPSSLMLLRYINVGLLCVQENPADRPTMSYVVSMLNNELALPPKPKQPAFSTSRTVEDTNPLLSNEENCSLNGVTMSLIQAR
ncbi:G-type lectin S-receptor-like serine/threonine-protein kinase At4g27290 [Camellia sinensis]|uniref:G-type lectin S-receptor-like serine/threonine-protein kinase At4g27290 n=1 Tax=Camellia sinensis TaxID=4442 RepID=UPI001036A5E6|nr:G-type lectin S-receptor-like serine/threonine-protein kinase At4g27290 [Camellia sinensis]